MSDLLLLEDIETLTYITYITCGGNMDLLLDLSKEKKKKNSRGCEGNAIFKHRSKNML